MGVTLGNKILRFQVYNCTMHHLYTVWYVHHPKSPSITIPPPPRRTLHLLSPVTSISSFPTSMCCLLALTLAFSFNLQ